MKVPTKQSRLLCPLVFWLFAMVAAPGAILYVDVNSTNSTPPYTNWITAATNIQDAVNAAVADDEIMVTNGIYTTANAATKRVSLRSVNGPEMTVIRGGAPNTIRCATLARGALLSGFTLTNGKTAHGLLFDGQGRPINPNIYRGGGVFCYGTETIVSNCVLVGNSAELEGGGAYGGTLMNCILTNNSALSGGGAAGGGWAPISDCILINCTLTGNSADWDGGGAYGGLYRNACTLVNCALATNSAWGSGAAARYCTLTNCVLIGNSGAVVSGARDSSLYNCALIRNFGEGARSCTLNNCTLFGNYPGATSSWVNNSIVYYNYGFDCDGTSTVNFSCTSYSPANGIGNVTNAPLFTRMFFNSPDLRLQSNSPCINAGRHAYAPAGSDLDGNLRIAGSTVDMGAYEFQGVGLSDFAGWLWQFGLRVDGSVDYSDSDHDLMNNWQEWIAGTIPTDALSALRLFSPTNDASGITVRWQSVTNRSYFLERATNLGATPPFSLVTSNIVGQAGTTSYTDTNAVGPGPFFYRVGVQ